MAETTVDRGIPTMYECTCTGSQDFGPSPACFRFFLEGKVGSPQVTLAYAREQLSLREVSQAQAGCVDVMDKQRPKQQLYYKVLGKL